MRVRLALLVLVSLALSGCFEDPVTETLVIQMVPERKAVVTATIKFGPELSGERIGPRLLQLREDYLRAQDPWTRRFDRIASEHEERTIERDRNGKDETRLAAPMVVSRVKHMVVVPRDELSFLFNESGVAVSAVHAAGRGELLIVPGTGTLSTAEQRKVLDKHLRAWAGNTVRYFGEVEALYDYLEAAPDRATAAFAWVFEDFVEEDVRKANALLDDEKELVKRVRDSMEVMADELTGIEEIPYGFNELAYLVYDPIPAALTVCIPREAERVEGFVADGNLCYSIPRRGIIEAFDALDGRWVAPDPFVTWIRIHRSQGSEKLDLQGFVAKPRSVLTLPDAATIIRSLEAGMRHEPAYRLEWIEAEPD